MIIKTEQKGLHYSIVPTKSQHSVSGMLMPTEVVVTSESLWTPKIATYWKIYKLLGEKINLFSMVIS